jgi:hypothetical protein
MVRESQGHFDVLRRATRAAHGDLVEAVDQLAHVAIIIPNRKGVNHILEAGLYHQNAVS